MCGMVWWGLVSFDEWSLFRRQALGFVITCRTCWPLAAEGRCHLQSLCTAMHSRFVAHKLFHLHVHSSSATKQTGDNSTRICVLGNGYTLNKLDTFVQWDLHDLETFGPLVAPLLCSVRYSFGP